jgi:putative transposase
MIARTEERERSAFENVAEYIARNPERANPVPSDKYHDYKYTGCLVPGYPDLNPWQNDYWDLFWRIYSRLRENGLMHSSDAS